LEKNLNEAKITKLAILKFFYNYHMQHSKEFIQIHNRNGTLKVL